MLVFVGTVLYFVYCGVFDKTLSHVSLYSTIAFGAKIIVNCSSRASAVPSTSNIAPVINSK